MKAYALDLRERVVKFLQGGGSKVEAARRFDLGRRTVYRYLAAAKAGTLAPKTSWGRRPESGFALHGGPHFRGRRFGGSGSGLFRPG